jgi:hypothetical protein
MPAVSKVITKAPAVHDKTNRTFIINTKTALEAPIRQFWF